MSSHNTGLQDNLHTKPNTGSAFSNKLKELLTTFHPMNKSV